MSLGGGTGLHPTSDGTHSLPELSIIVPVHNGAGTLRACLEAVLSAPGPARELIVVDDGSHDNSADIAASLGVRVFRNPHNRGCAAARNSGANYTTAPILVFVDADVVIHSSALERISRFMLENPGYSAVFGSYDSEPDHPGFVSQYRNLLHHFTHQSGKLRSRDVLDRARRDPAIGFSERGRVSIQSCSNRGYRPWA